jgi:8-oxo-dGTP diphosphatase
MGWESTKPWHMTICYLIHNNRLLMTHRNQKEKDIHRGMYIAPGGTIEAGETPYRAMGREFFEETGLTLHNPKHIGYVFFDNTQRVKPNGDPFKANAHLWVYRAESASGDLNPTDEMGNRNLWVSTGHVLDHPMHEGDKFLWKQITGHDWDPFDAYIKHIDQKFDKKNSYIDFH